MKMSPFLCGILLCFSSGWAFSLGRYGNAVAGVLLLCWFMVDQICSAIRDKP